MVLVAGLLLTQLLALCDPSGVSGHFAAGQGDAQDQTGIPFWPIWWSQTGLSEGSWTRRLIFVGTTSLTSFLYAICITMKWQSGALSAQTYILGLAGTLYFAGLGLVNTNLGSGRIIHGAFAGMSGVLTVAHLALATAEPSDRFRLILHFGLLFVLEKACARFGGWDPSRAVFATPNQLVLFRISALAQWAQLLLFAYWSL